MESLSIENIEGMDIVSFDFYEDGEMYSADLLLNQGFSLPTFRIKFRFAEVSEGCYNKTIFHGVIGRAGEVSEN